MAQVGAVLVQNRMTRGCAQVTPKAVTLDGANRSNQWLLERVALVCSNKYIHCMNLSCTSSEFDQAVQEQTNSDTQQMLADEPVCCFASMQLNSLHNNFLRYASSADGQIIIYPVITGDWAFGVLGQSMSLG